jgi:hypothetical protein
MVSSKRPNGYHLPFDIPAMKARLPLPSLLDMLGLGVLAHKSAFCPFHENTDTPAFSVFQTMKGWRWRCHSQCGSGDEIDFIERLEKCSRGEAIVRYSQLAGVPGTSNYVPSQSRKTSLHVTSCVEIRFPDDLHKGCQAELDAVAKLRKVDFWAVATMQQNGVLLFGSVCGFDCWIVTDPTRKVAEARRLDGQMFPAFRGGNERKAHTLRGSSKSWPVGLILPRHLHDAFQNILLVEGSGDFVAAYHLCIEKGINGQNWQPVAMLGATARIHPEAFPLFRGKRVKIIPHIDEAGSGGAQNWATDLKQIGREVGGFDLAGLRTRDGSNVKDLNDCTHIHPDDAAGLEGLLK